MTEAGAIAMSAGAGVLLGLVFFWALKLTVERLVTARHPVAWMLGSLLLRFGFVLAGFYFIARNGEWLAVMAAMLGFTAARFAISRRARTASTREGVKT